VAGSTPLRTVQLMRKKTSLTYQAKRPLWRRLLPFASVLAVLGLLVSLYVVRSGARPNFGAGDLVTGGDGVKHSVYVDGWTMRTLGSKPIRYQSGVEGTENFTDPLPLTFTPLDGGDLEALLETDPEILEDAFARLVSGDLSLRCTTVGCRTATAELPLSLLADPATVGGIGSLYTAWNISAGLYRAEFSAPAGQPVTYSLEKAGALTVFEAAEGEKVIGEDGTEITLQPVIDASNGWGRRSWYLASAWQTIFIPETRWNDPTPVINDRGRGDFERSTDANPTPVDPSLLARGLADKPAQTLAAMSRSQLTYFSSPVTGCGVAALCIPDSIEVTVRETGRQSMPVCSTDGRYATAVALTTDWSVKLIGQTHAFGAWNGEDPQNFPGAEGKSVLGYRGAPSLVGGQMDLRVNLWMLVSSAGETFAVAGSRGQIGIDGPEFTRATASLSEIGSYFEGDWSVCS
jgi:hypothetical protein